MPPQNPAADGYFICDYGRFSGKDFSQDRLYHYALNGSKVKSTEALTVFAEKAAAAKKILVLGGATESCDDVDALEALIQEWRAQGKEVVWDFRTDTNAFHDGKSQWDFLLSRDLRPNAKYLRDRNATGLMDYAELEKELRASEMVVLIGELAAPYAYQTGEIHANVKGLTIHGRVEDTELFQSLNASLAWGKTAVFTTHVNAAAELAAITLPMRAFPEKSGRYVDKTGAEKHTTAVLQPVQGLQSPKDILLRLKNASPAAGAAV
jgi:NADH-quinone oxidoreductase subunit G